MSTELAKVGTFSIDRVERELLGIRDGYTAATAVMLRWMSATGNTFNVEGIRAWDKYLREPQGGKVLGGASRNMYRKTIKHRTRWLLDQVDGIPASVRMQIVHALGELKYDQVQAAARGEDSCFTEAETVRLLEYLRAKNPRLALMVEFIVTVGTRISETLGILNSDVHVRGDMASILLHGKGSKRYRQKDRTIYVDKELLARIRVFYRGSAYLFGRGVKDQRYRREYVSVVLNRASGALFNKPLGVHALRHTFATLELHAHPEELKSISEWLGHADISTTNRYLHGGWDGTKAKTMLRSWAAAS